MICLNLHLGQGQLGTLLTLGTVVELKSEYSLGSVCGTNVGHFLGLRPLSQTRTQRLSGFDILLFKHSKIR